MLISQAEELLRREQTKLSQSPKPLPSDYARDDPHTASLGPKAADRVHQYLALLNSQQDSGVLERFYPVSTVVLPERRPSLLHPSPLLGTPLEATTVEEHCTPAAGSAASSPATVPLEPPWLQREETSMVSFNEWLEELGEASFRQEVEIASGVELPSPRTPLRTFITPMGAGMNEEIRQLISLVCSDATSPHKREQPPEYLALENIDTPTGNSTEVIATTPLEQPRVDIQETPVVALTQQPKQPSGLCRPSSPRGPPTDAIAPPRMLSLDVRPVPPTEMLAYDESSYGKILVECEAPPFTVETEHLPSHRVRPFWRYVVRVVDVSGRPISDCAVRARIWHGVTASEARHQPNVEPNLLEPISPDDEFSMQRLADHGTAGAVWIQFEAECGSADAEYRHGRSLRVPSVLKWHDGIPLWHGVHADSTQKDRGPLTAAELASLPVGCVEIRLLPQARSPTPH